MKSSHYSNFSDLSAFGSGDYIYTNGINMTVTYEEVGEVQPEPQDHVIESSTPKYRISDENPWGLLGHTLDLSKWAADYYLLLLLQIQDPSDTNKIMFNTKADKICDQFVRYTDMAVGGEIRHTWTNNFPIMARPLVEALQDGTVGRSSNGTSRNSAWTGWYWFRQKYGDVALKWATETFNKGEWGNAYGGKKWGNISNTLYLYETGEITRDVFIDTCWGLQHNGGTYFNKWWGQGLYQLQEVLNLNLNGNYCGVYQYASAMVKKLATGKIEDVCSCNAH